MAVASEVGTEFLAPGGHGRERVGSPAETPEAKAESANAPMGKAMLWPPPPELLSLIADAIVSTDESGKIVLFNKAAEEMFGYEMADVLGQPVEILMPERLRRAHHRSLTEFAGGRRAAGSAMGERRKVIGIRRNGEEFPLEASLSRSFVKGRALLTAVIRDASERQRLDEAKALIAAELAHRFKNSMALVGSIVRLTARSATSIDGFAEALQGRLDALARTHSILFQDSANVTDVRALIESELSPYRSPDGENLLLSGERTRLSSKMAVNLGLALHELAANAAKYGALTRRGGKVSINWRVVRAAREKHLVLEWKEAGGPPVAPPARRGFGTELIERCLGDGAAIHYEKAGLRARFEIPAE